MNRRSSRREEAHFESGECKTDTDRNRQNSATHLRSRWERRSPLFVNPPRNDHARVAERSPPSGRATVREKVSRTAAVRFCQLPIVVGV